MPSCGTALGLGYGGTGVDPDALRYINTAGITDATAKSAIIAFVQGIKSLGLWNNMRSWPLIAAQNKGTGTIAYGLGGNTSCNISLLNSISWGTNGIDKLTSAGQLQIDDNMSLMNSQSLICVYKASGSTGYANLRPLLFGGCNNTTDTGTQLLYSTDGTRNSTVMTNRAGVNAFSATTSIPAGREFMYNCCLWAINNSTTVNKVNNNAATILTGLNPKTTISSSLVELIAPNIGAYGSNSSAFGSYPFAAVFNCDMTEATMSQIYALYKSTLGSGLSLQ